MGCKRERRREGLPERRIQLLAGVVIAYQRDVTRTMPQVSGGSNASRGLGR